MVLARPKNILIFKKKKPEGADLDETQVDMEPVKEEVTPVATETTTTEPTTMPLEQTVEIDETGIEEAILGEKFSNTLEGTVDIDEALSDLMSTKQYDFRDKE